MFKLYKIVRHFQNTGRRVTVATHLTLEDAVAHCRNPETSSSTCKGAVGKARTHRSGPWFDSYTAE